jgi:hypothetical protein
MPFYTILRDKTSFANSSLLRLARLCDNLKLHDKVLPLPQACYGRVYFDSIEVVRYICLMLLPYTEGRRLENFRSKSNTLRTRGC